MAEDATLVEPTRPGLPISPGLAIGLFIGVLALLFAAYWFILRTDYVPVFERLPESDAAAVVAELTERKIDHRLADGGTTILVASGQADQARLDIASSELPLRGQIGFELFNESDMGLTEFAQKINYQRALQGELARTIMLLDGIENARVHLAMPERALFRGTRNAPTAAVTLMLRPGHSITANRIGGIQRLVAGAVPELDIGAVAILDETGRLVSSSESAPASTDSGETEAVGQYYRARVSAAIADLAPNLDNRIRVVVRQRAEMAIGSTPTTAANVDPTVGAVATGQAVAAALTTPARRNYALEVEVTTATPITESLRDQLSRAIAAAAGLDQSQDDRLVFAVGPTGALATAAAMPSEPVVASASARPAAPVRSDWGDDWKWVVAVVMAALLGGLAAWLLTRRNGRAGDDPAALDSFADQLRARLAAAEGGYGSA
jgi:flagellar M-ring protein FliF